MTATIEKVLDGFGGLYEITIEDQGYNGKTWRHVDWKEAEEEGVMMALNGYHLTLINLPQTMQWNIEAHAECFRYQW